MCIVITCCPVYDVINFEINLNFFIKPFSLWSKKSEKNGRIKLKAFFIIFKGLSQKQMKTKILEGDSPTLKHQNLHIT